MAESELQKQISALAAKVTALTMLVESLYVQELSNDADPAAIGDAIIKSVFDAEKHALEKAGESVYALQISEELSSLIDRAVARVLFLRSKGRPG
jgi:hypothetical protein